MKPTKHAIEIPKHIVEQSAEFAGPDSSYENMLRAYKQFEAADMTPIFLYDSRLHILFCVAKETYEKKLH
jgi:hypothetical protein